MGDIAGGFQRALILLLSFDPEIYQIISLSLYVSLFATLLGAVIGVPLGIIMGIKEFCGKKIVVHFIYTMMSLPPVIVGLVVFLLLSRKGPLGFMGLSFTPTAMIIAQVFLITPIIIGVIYNGTREKGKEIRDTAKTLGADPYQVFIILVKELRVNIIIGIVSGYGRAISEVGAVMIVGGNIKGHTRVMTTTIAMLRSMGDYETALAIGMVLLILSFFINSILYHFQRGGD